MLVGPCLNKPSKRVITPRWAGFTLKVSYRARPWMSGMGKPYLKYYLVPIHEESPRSVP